jgi:hypothetical protein
MTRLETGLPKLNWDRGTLPDRVSYAHLRPTHRTQPTSWRPLHPDCDHDRMALQYVAKGQETTSKVVRIQADNRRGPSESSSFSPFWRPCARSTRGHGGFS